MRIAVSVCRVVGAIVILVAVVAQGATTVSFFASTGKGTDPHVHGLINFVSFFTIDSNFLGAVTLVIGSVIALRFTKSDPRWFSLVRLCAVTYLTVTGVVYNVLLRSVELPQGRTLDWANEILHLVGPAILLVDWLFAPGRTSMRYRDIRIVVLFPIAWVAYSLVRGPIAVDPGTGSTPFYPYPFLDPATGLLSVGIYIAVIALVICLIAAGLIWISRHARWPLPLDAVKNVPTFSQ